jgi:hypothetical protein
MLFIPCFFVDSLIMYYSQPLSRKPRFGIELQIFTYDKGQPLTFVFSNWRRFRNQQLSLAAASSKYPSLRAFRESLMIRIRTIVVLNAFGWAVGGPRHHQRSSCHLGGGITVDTSARVWIDTICLDDEDLIVRAAQAGWMSKVYSSASSIGAWLEPVSRLSDLAIRCKHTLVSKLSDRETGHPEPLNNYYSRGAAVVPSG